MAETMEYNNSLPIDRGWAWVIVFGHFMNLFFMVGTAKSIGILLEEFHLYFQIPMAFSATVMSISGIVYAVAAPLCIMLAQKFTARRVIMIGGFVGFIGMSVSCSLVSMLFIIIFFGIGFGIGNAAIYGNGLIMLGQYFKDRRSFANGIALAGSSIGQFAMPPLIQYLLETYSLSGTLLLLGGLYFHVTLFGSLFRPFSFYKERCSKPEEITEFMEYNKTAKNDTACDKTTNGNGSDCCENMVNENKMANGFNIDGNDETNLLRNRFANECDKTSVDTEDDENELTHDMKLRAVLASTGSIYLASMGELEDMSKEHNASRIYKNDIPKSTSMKSFLKEMFDFAVLKNYICIFYSLVSFLGFFGQFNFVLFLPSYALTRGITRYNKAILVSICGMCDLVGRLFFGYLGDTGIIQRYRIKSICLILLGINTMMFAFANTFPWIAVHSGVYGFFGGGFVGMIAVVLIDFVGLDLMPKCLAVVLLFQGIGAAIGQPLLGSMKDSTGNYDNVAFLCGSCSLCAGMLLLLWPIVKKMESRRSGTGVSHDTNEFVVSEVKGESSV